MRDDFEHLYGKAVDIWNDPDERGVLSTSERLAVAMVLNKPEWLAESNYTLAEAIQWIGPEWLALVPRIAKALDVK